LTRALSNADFKLAQRDIRAFAPYMKLVAVLDRYHGLDTRLRLAPAAQTGSDFAPPPPLALSHAAAPAVPPVASKVRNFQAAQQNNFLTSLGGCSIFVLTLRPEGEGRVSGSVTAFPPAAVCKRSVGAQRAARPAKARGGAASRRPTGARDAHPPETADRRSLEPLRFGRRRCGAGGPGGRAGSPGNGAAKA